jgi:hypothetical protein
MSHEDEAIGITRADTYAQFAATGGADRHGVQLGAHGLPTA